MANGYRGYIASRPVRGNAIPQRVQNLVIRDYAARRSLPYRLSVTEYAMQNCYMMLEDAIAELERLDGLIVYSLFLLPEDPAHRRRIYERFLATGTQLHAALEDLAIVDRTGIDAFEDITAVAHALAATPFGGRYEKDDEPLGPQAERLVRALEGADG